jgi:hypothetical protein
MTGNVQSRLLQHSKQDYWRVVRGVEVEDLSDRDAAVMREGDLIYELDPPLNKTGRRTREGETGAPTHHGQIVSCSDCTAMGLIRYGESLIDAGWVNPHEGNGFGNPAHFHRCPARRLSAA